MDTRDTNSNEIWLDCTNYDDFETSRPVLFREDMREMFLKWFRIKPDHKVLDGGCGPGVLTRFIAKGLDTGKVTGFDISRYFVEYGNKKIAEEGLSDKAEIVLEDGYNLSFADNTFDSIVNHMYIGVLSDADAGMKELIRVCKPGGTVSVSTSGGIGGGGGTQYDCAFEGNERMSELHDKYNEAYRKIYAKTELKQDNKWADNAHYPKLIAGLGLKNITIHPYATAFSYSDSYWSDEFKIYRIKAGIGRDIEILENNGNDIRFNEYGFSNEEFDELTNLHREKQKYLLNNLDDNGNWEWRGGSYLIVSGTKI